MTPRAPKDYEDSPSDELPELDRAIDRHFFRAKVVMSAMLVAIGIGAPIASLVTGIQRDIANHRFDVERDLGAISSRTAANHQLLEERGLRIANIERAIYDLQTNYVTGAPPFTIDDYNRMKAAMEKRISDLEFNQSQPRFQQRLQDAEAP